MRPALLLLQLIGTTLPLALVGAGAARADNAAADPVAAEALFQQGRAAFKRGDYATACPKFAESNRLDPAAGSLFNLADCLERQGRLASAWQRWHELVDLLRPTPTDERLGIARQHAADLTPRLPQLRVHWDGEPVPGAVVKRDGVELGAASIDLPLPTDAGPHKIEVVARGRKTRVYQVVTRDGTITDLPIVAGDRLAQRAEVVPPPPREPDVGPRRGDPVAPPRDAGTGSGGGSGITTAGWILFGVGAAAAAVAVGSGIKAVVDKGVVDKECGADKVCSPTGYSAAGDGHTMATMATVTTIAAGVLGVTGIILVAVGKAKSSRHATFAPTVVPGGAGLAIAGTF